MHIKYSNNKKILVISQSDLSKQAGFFDSAKKAVNDYYKGLQQVYQIRKNNPNDQRAMWKAMEQVEQIGKNLQVYNKNLQESKRILHQIQTAAEGFNSKTPRQQQVTVNSINHQIMKMPEIGQQAFVKAMYAMENSGFRKTKSDLPIASVPHIAEQAINIIVDLQESIQTKKNIQDSNSIGLNTPLQDFKNQNQESYEEYRNYPITKIVQQILDLPISQRIKIVHKIVDQTPELQNLKPALDVLRP